MNLKNLQKSRKLKVRSTPGVLKINQRKTTTSQIKDLELIRITNKMLKISMMRSVQRWPDCFRNNQFAHFEKSEHFSDAVFPKIKTSISKLARSFFFTFLFKLSQSPRYSDQIFWLWGYLPIWLQRAVASHTNRSLRGNILQTPHLATVSGCVWHSAE